MSNQDTKTCSCGLQSDELTVAVFGHTVCSDCVIICIECGEEVICPACVKKDDDGNKFCSSECKMEAAEKAGTRW